MGRPQRSIAAENASISAAWYGQSMSSTLRKSTPQPAYSASTES